MTRPASWVWRGTVPVVGFWQPHTDLGGLLPHWTTGTRALSLHGGVLLLWPQAQICVASSLPGLAVVADGTRLLSGPFEVGTGPCVVLGWGGEVMCTPLSELVAVRVHRALPSLAPKVPSQALGRPPAALGTTMVVGSVGEALGVKRVPIAPAEVVPAKPPTGIAAMVAGWLLSRSVPTSDGSSALSEAPAATTSTSASSVESAQPPWWAQALGLVGLGEWLHQWAMRQTNRTVSELEDLFADDLDEALRRASPLGRGNRGDDTPWSWPSPNTPRELRFDQPARGGGGSMASNAWETLETLYERAFDTLVRQERYREAAFVLGDLLDKPEEAVGFMESHGLHDEAAQFALARGLSPGIVVRCLAAAGRLQEAVLWGRRTGAFSSAVSALEAREPGSGAALRLEWAEVVAATGDVGAAIAILWPVESERERALPWLDATLQGAGVPVARCVVRRMQLRPDEPEALLAPLSALFGLQGPPGWSARESLARELAGVVKRSSPLVDRLIRTMLRDLSDGASTAGIEDLVHFDPVLAADLPPLGARRQTSPDATLELHDDDVGTVEVFDAVGLPGGRVLVALGETGVELLTATGSCIRRWGTPARRIVVVDSGRWAWVGIPRGDAASWHRLDLVTGQRSLWSDQPFSPAAQTTDGVGWWVAEGRRLTLIDMQSPTPRGLWSVDLGEVLHLTRRDRWLTALVFDQGVYETFSYLDAQLKRRSRIDLPPDATAVYLENHGVWAEHLGRLARFPGTPEGMVPGYARTGEEGWTWTASGLEDGRVRDVLAAPGGAVVRTVERQGVVRGRMACGQLATWDERGRVHVFDLEHRAQVADLRR